MKFTEKHVKCAGKLPLSYKMDIKKIGYKMDTNQIQKAFYMGLVLVLEW